MGLYQVVSLIHQVIDIYGWIIIIWCLMTWIPMRPGTFFDDVRGALGMLVEPFLNVIRRFIPPMMGIDWSPVVAIFFMNVLERVIYMILL